MSFSGVKTIAENQFVFCGFDDASYERPSDFNPVKLESG